MKEVNNENEKIQNTDTIINLVSSDKFGGYSDSLQERILNSIDVRRKSDGGLMGKLFGNKKENAAMNISAIICFLLILLCAVDVLSAIFTEKDLHMELISCIVPVVSLALGFMFGKGGEKN